MWGLGWQLRNYVTYKIYVIYVISLRGTAAKSRAENLEAFTDLEFPLERSFPLESLLVLGFLDSWKVGKLCTNWRDEDAA